MIDVLLAMALALQPAEAQCNAATAAPLPAGCTAWRPLFQNAEAQVFADHGSVRRNPGGFDLVVRMVFAADRPGGMRSGVLTYRFDCAGATTTLLHARYFNAGGGLLAEGPPRNARPLPSPAGSPNRLALDLFCPAPAPAR